MMMYKIVRDGSFGYNVMYKKSKWNRWRYCRRPKGQVTDDSFFAYVWRWSTEKGAQVFINQQLKDERTN